jgi:uncharacterized protein
MPVVTIALALLALLGHAALWVGFVNRMHAVGASRVATKLASCCGYALLVFVPVVALEWWMSADKPLGEWLQQIAAHSVLWLYLVPCWAIGTAIIVLWVRRYCLAIPHKAILSNRTTVINVARELGHKPLFGWRARALSVAPGNQVLQLDIEEKEFGLERLPAPLDGLSITHLSDLHFTGLIGREFFEEVAKHANALRSDMIVITGDILDELELLDWIPEVLGRLSAALGAYFVLGNHDEFTNAAPRVREALTAIDLIDVGNQWRRLDVAGVDVVLAGNEAPWFSPPPDMQDCPVRTTDHPQLRLLLSHSPDQFAWARRWDFDLMLAGHTHGGQIRLPLVGPIFAPSWHGVKYAGGTFYRHPTLMHVSRGISAELPLRLNCRPELTKIVLRAKK